jgi:RNA polymerase sigma factor (sigma-70 family)
MELLCAEDRRAWNFVYEDMKKVLIPIANRRTASAPASKDLMHDCLAEVCMRLRKAPMKTYEQFRAFCIRCMLNHCYDYRLGTQRRKEQEQLFMLDDEDIIHSQIGDKHLLVKKFLSLPPRARQIIRMYYLELHNLREISSILALSERQVKRIHAGFHLQLREMKEVV